MGKKLRPQPSIEELSAQAIVKYQTGNIHGGDQIKRRLMNRYGRNRARKALDEAHQSFRLLTGDSSLSIKWYAGFAVKGRK